jgi:dihydrofolate reductase
MGGQVVVNRCISLDGFIAAPGGRMDWGSGRQLSSFIAREDYVAVAGETGAMLCGRRTWEVGDEMAAENPDKVDYPFDGPVFLLSHRPLDPPDPDVPILSGDVRDAVATALAAAGDKNLELLGADVAAQCFEAGLVDEVLVYVLPVILGDGVRFSPPGMSRVELEPYDVKQSGEATILRFRVVR